MRRKLILALAAVGALCGAAGARVVSAQDAVDGQPYNCFGGYGGGCGDSWIKNCYC